VIQASQSLSCIFVDCDWGKKNSDLSDRYKVGGYPTVVFCDPEGKPLRHLQGQDPESVAKQMLEFSAKYNSKPDPKGAVPQISGKTFLQARAEARRSSKPVLFYFSDDSPASTSVNLALVDPLLRDTIGRFVLAKADYRKGSDECVKFDVSRAPTILVLDCTLEKPEEKPLARIAGSRSARELKRDLESSLGAERVAPDPTTSKPSSSSPGPKQPEEKLSDDELDRRFIQARLDVATDMIKRGNKEKAIEVLEDIIKTYPKHVETLVAKKLLEEIRK
jgi:thioredoxin-like negative regulator of GroEL